jgi:hypothetical protein
MDGETKGCPECQPETDWDVPQLCYRHLAELAARRGAELDAMRKRVADLSRRKPPPATAAMLAYCGEEEADSGHAWDEQPAGIIRRFIEEWEAIDEEGRPRAAGR